MINNSNRWSVAILIKFSITFKTISCSVLTENNDVINCFKIYLLFKIWIFAKNLPKTINYLYP